MARCLMNSSHLGGMKRIDGQEMDRRSTWVEIRLAYSPDML